MSSSPTASPPWGTTRATYPTSSRGRSSSSGCWRPRRRTSPPTTSPPSSAGRWSCGDPRMTATSSRVGGSDAADVVAALQRHGVRDVDASQLARTLYSSDASIYRVAPLVVVRPRHTDEMAAVLAVARETGTPLTMRGAGTSIAGNAVGAGIVMDTARHLNRVLSLDPESRTAV